MIVRGTGALGARATAAPGAVPEEVLRDVSCSIGVEIVEYRWRWDWVPGQPPYTVTASPCCEEIRHAAPGTKQIGGEVLDDTRAPDATIVESAVP